MPASTVFLRPLSDDKQADAATHSRRATSPAFLLSSVLQHTTHPPPIPSTTAIPPPLPPPHEHSRRTSIPPPLPQWFLSDSSTPPVHPPQQQQPPQPPPPASPLSRTTVLSVSTPPSAGSGGRHGRNQSAGAVPFFASAFASMSPRTKAHSTAASSSALASPASAAASPIARPSPPSKATTLSVSASPPSPSATPSSPPPPPPTTRDILDALRLLCSGRVFRSYTAPAPPTPDAFAPPQQCDWLLFFDIDDSPFDAVRGRGQSAPAPSATAKRRAADEQKEQTAAAQAMDQRGVLFYNVVGAGQPQKQKLAQQRVPLSAITSVLLGKQSALLLHPSLARLREDCCFSLALSDGRELCFSSKSPIMLVTAHLQRAPPLLCHNHLSCR